MADVSGPALMDVNCPDFLYACWYGAGCWGGAVFAKVVAMSKSRHGVWESDAAAGERVVLRGSGEYVAATESEVRGFVAIFEPQSIGRQRAGGGR